MLEQSIAKLPVNQQQEARDMIDSAHKLGWKSIGFWTGDDPIDISDLFAIHPTIPNRGYFLTWELLNE
jgi:hypothetical protein